MTSRWFQTFVVAILFAMAVGSLWAARTYARGRWVVAEYESRGPNRTAKVLVNDRTGVVCELNRQSPDSALGGDAFWMCSAPPKGGQRFFPK
jgi:hypothetical protein